MSKKSASETEALGTSVTSRRMLEAVQAPCAKLPYVRIHRKAAPGDKGANRCRLRPKQGVTTLMMSVVPLRRRSLRPGILKAPIKQGRTPTPA